jgi:hypothetical protein
MVGERPFGAFSVTVSIAKTRMDAGTGTYKGFQLHGGHRNEKHGTGVPCFSIPTAAKNQPQGMMP